MRYNPAASKASPKGRYTLNRSSREGAGQGGTDDILEVQADLTQAAGSDVSAIAVGSVSRCGQVDFFRGGSAHGTQDQTWTVHEQTDTNALQGYIVN